MTLWLWVPVILAAWFALALALGLVLGPVLARCSRIRDALDAQVEDHLASLRDEEAP